MEKYIEIEYKTFVNGDRASSLLAQGVFKHGQLQTNYYYDTNDLFFTSQRGVLRIREKNELFRFTAKIRKDHYVEEYECDLDHHDINDLKIRQFIHNYTLANDFVYLGKTTTYRYTYQDEYGVWCLDFNVLKYNSDIELEFELHEDILEAKTHFLNQLEIWQIHFSPSQPKFERLLNDKDSTD